MPPASTHLAGASLAVRYIFRPAPGEFNRNVPESSDRLGMAAATDGYELSLALITNLQEPNRFNSSLRNGVSELVCFQLQSDLAIECVEGYGFEGDEVRALAPLQFVACGLDTGGELMGKISL